MPHAGDPQQKADHIRTTAESFCHAFAVKESPYTTLDQYFTSTATILEHGPVMTCLPFLGVTFTGRRSESGSKNTCDDYYDLLTSVLSFHPDERTVPPKEQFMVDPERGTVTIKLHAKFASIKTGKSWEEDLVYILSEFDEHGMIGNHEIWADPLSAWVAVQDP